MDGAPIPTLEENRCADFFGDEDVHNMFFVHRISTNLNYSVYMISAVKGLHVLSFIDLGNLVRDAESVIILIKHNGSSLQIIMAKNLGIQQLAQLLSFKRDEERLRYLLCGLKFFHILADRDSKLNQIQTADW